MTVYCFDLDGTLVTQTQDNEGKMHYDECQPITKSIDCLLYTSPSPRDQRGSRMPSSA